MKCLFFLSIFTLIAFSTLAQDSTYNQMLDNSRPGSSHALLGRLTGTWSFQDAGRSFVKGTAVRTPVYDGRFYKVEIVGGKLQVPVADGKMKEDNYQEMQIEGFDNGRMEFITTSINNHIGSDIEIEIGTYDSTTRSFTYTWTSELIAGRKTQNWRVLKINDDNHYSEEFFEDGNSAKFKTREINYTKLKN